MTLFSSNFDIRHMRNSRIKRLVMKQQHINKSIIQYLGQLVFIGFVIGLMTGFSGCSPKSLYDKPAISALEHDRKDYIPGRFDTTFVVDQLDAYYRGTGNGPIGVTTIVNLDDLYASSTFGRMFSEQVISELAMRGFDVVELRHAEALNFLTGTGEFALSRDIRQVRQARDLAGVLVGTYVVSPVRVYVNMRLVDPATSVILAAATTELDKTREIDRMMRGNSMQASLERIPVRHLGLRTYPVSLSQGSNEESMEVQAQDSWSVPQGVEPRIVEKPAPKKTIIDLENSVAAKVEDPTAKNHQVSGGDLKPEEIK